MSDKTWKKDKPSSVTSGEVRDLGYHYVECGLDYVYIQGGMRHETRRQKEYIVIDKVTELHRLIGDDIVRNRSHLSGPEIRFLRNEMNLTQAMFGHLLRVTDQTVARWEKGITECDGPADALIRMRYMQFVDGDEDILKAIDEIADIDDVAEPVRIYAETKSGWKRAA